MRELFPNKEIMFMFCRVHHCKNDAYTYCYQYLFQLKCVPCTSLYYKTTVVNLQKKGKEVKMFVARSGCVHF